MDEEPTTTDAGTTAVTTEGDPDGNVGGETNTDRIFLGITSTEAAATEQPVEEEGHHRPHNVTYHFHGDYETVAAHKVNYYS